MIATLSWLIQAISQSALFHANREAFPMASYFRLTLPLVAIAAVSMLSIASPASAAGTGEAVSTNAARAPSDVRHRTSQRIRLAASRERYVRPIRSDAGCSGTWCHRHFVLMVGIAY
jgi:hypothetical protein